MDEIGLASPAFAARRTQGPGWMTDVLEQGRPDWLLLRAVSFTRPMQAVVGCGLPFRSPRERSSVMSRYRLDLSFPTDWEIARRNPSSCYLLAGLTGQGPKLSNIVPTQ